jgi:hypothetical protein
VPVRFRISTTLGTPAGAAVGADTEVDAMVYSLIDRPWISARRRSGAAAKIRPADITGELGDDPVVALDWPRQEQRVACLEFLIGLLATARPPADTDDWERAWRSPPGPDELHVSLAPYGHAFMLDGDGPRFMQDLTDFAGEKRGVETARERVIRRCFESHFGNPSARRIQCGPAAVALYSMQRYCDAKRLGRWPECRRWIARAKDLGNPTQPGSDAALADTAGQRATWEWRPRMRIARRVLLDCQPCRIRSCHWRQYPAETAPARARRHGRQAFGAVIRAAMGELFAQCGLPPPCRDLEPGWKLAQWHSAFRAGWL